MIWQRLATSIREQDWLSVIIEMFIVVLGVFLGLQVNNWNEARISRVDAAHSRHQLISDLRADLDAFAVRQQWYDEVFEAALSVDNALRSKRPETVDEMWRFVRDAYAASGEWVFAPSAQVYKDLQNAGDLSLIASGSIQRRLRDYYEDSAHEVEVSLTFRSAYAATARQLIEGQVSLAISDCLSGSTLEPSRPGASPGSFFGGCSQPDNVELLRTSAERLYQSDVLRSQLNLRLINVASVRSLLDYLDRQARSLVSELEAVH